MRVAILGGSGFIGTALEAALRERGQDVLATSLRDPRAAASRVSDCDVIVNLAGEPVAQRWTRAALRRIYQSRTELPRTFLAALRSQRFSAHAYVSASGVGYYGSRADELLDESSAPGDGILANVCIQWERVASEAQSLGMRTACVRTGLALGCGGALRAMLPVFRLGLGGRLGDGRQWWPWIHIDDLVGIYLLAIDGASGTLNAVAPAPVRNGDFTRVLGRVLHRPEIVPVPAFALRALLGEGASVVLEGQRVQPKRATQLGYRFAFGDLQNALAAILG